MKRLFFTLSTIFISIAAFSAVYTVSNNPAAPAQFSDLQTAINSSSPGDTIYIQGSNTNYGTGNTYKVDRKLTFIGAGFDVVNTDYKLNTVVYAYIKIDSTGLYPISGCKFVGINFYNSNIGTNNTTTSTTFIQNNVTFERCLFNSHNLYVSGNGWVIKNCLFYNSSYIYVNNQSNIYGNLTISNNIFYQFYYQCINNASTSSVFILNNLFVNCGSDVNNVSNANIYNNIYYSSGAGANASACIYNNNITYNSTAVTLPSGTNTGSNNKIQVSPKFVSGTIPAPGSYPTNNWGSFKTYDWHLQAGSPGYLAGSDGTDIGIYGGVYPWVNFYGQSNLPLIESFNIKNPVVQVNGTLNVTIKAKTQQ